MGKIFNIAGPCNPEDHFMLSATERIPDVMRLIEDKAYFVVHAQRQCGKTTAFRALVDDIPMIYEMIRGEAQYRPELKQCPFLTEGHRRFGEPITLADMHEAKEKIIREKSHEKAYDQVFSYMDRLGVSEGWLVVFNPDLAKPCWFQLKRGTPSEVPARRRRHKRTRGSGDFPSGCDWCGKEPAVQVPSR